MATKVHRIRHYNPSPQSINCVSYNKVSKQVAVARSDASIEIWDLSYAPYLLKFIPGVENGSIEALGWVNNRLLSTGLGGALLEWDLDKLSVKTTVLLTGYAAWCLDVNPVQTLVAVGTEQGYVNLYSVEDNEIQYRKLFDKQEGRILCCKFDHTGGILVTGSVDTIRVWNVETGQALSRMSARRRGQETVVWCLAVLSDNTVVSGESGGRLTFWDISTGDQIESFTTHKADILSLVVVDGEKSLYCSGVDPIIVNFIKVENKKEVPGGGCQWVKNVQRHIHEHDVRCLAMHEDQLISVGVDGYLTFSSFPPKWVMRIPPMLPQPRSSVSRLKKLVLLKYRNHLEVWKLGAYATNLSGSILTSNVNLGNQHKKTDNTSDSLEADSDVATTNQANVYQGKAETLILTECPLKLVSLQTKSKKQIRCAEMSPNGEFIAYSTDSDIRILKLEMDDEANTTSLSKVLVHGLAAQFCDRMAFTHDSQDLLLHCAGTVYMLQVDAGAGATVTLTLPTDQYNLSPTLLHLLISAPTPSRATYLAAADTAGRVHVWCRKGKSMFESHAALPKYHCVPSAATIDSENERLILVFVDQTLMEYSLASKKFSDWPQHELPYVWFRTHAARTGALPHPRRAGALVLHDETALWLLDRTLQNGSGDPSYAKKKPDRQRKHSFKSASVRIIPTKYLADFHWIGEDEAAMVEVLPQNIIAQLPPVSNTRHK